jgi:hypothetical protein
LREWQKNTLVSVLSVVCFYSVIEVMVWRRVLDRVPLHLQSELGRLSVFGQTSKNGIVPNDYIMMIGDSYVEGLGRSEKVGHLHGPNDPSHLNERGYTALGEVLALGLSGQSPAPCALGLVD